MPTAVAPLPTEAPPAAVEVVETPVETSAAEKTVAPWQSFFWRIFLWFWLATLILAGAVGTTVYLTDPDQFFPRSPFVPLQMIDRLAAESTAVLERSGPTALREYLVGLPHAMSANNTPARARFESAYLFDADTARELAGQQLRIDPRDLVSRTKDSADLQLERHVGRIYMARAVRGNGGSDARYVFVVSMPRASLLLPTTPQVAFELAAAVITSALVCYWLARQVVSPLRLLQAATKRLAEGDLGTRVAAAAGELTRRHDEFGVLARDFDEMAARIEDLLIAQKRLIADISHELGTPLTRLNVALGLAFRKSGEGPPRAELNRIQTEAGRLNDLIRQLLMISELEIHASVEGAETLDLLALATEVADDAEFEASGRSCRVTVRASGPLPCKGVRHLLRSAIENVVRNAVRYTAEGSEVMIELQALPARAVIRVRDQGPGVPAPELANLFRPFYRVSEARDRLSGGTGLGLAITQQAIEAHGGSVRASNQPTGGLLVELELPLNGALSSPPKTGEN